MGIFDFLKKKQQDSPSTSAQKVESQQDKLEKGLEKTKTGFFSKITKAVAGKSTIDIDFLDELEEALMTSDVGLETTVKIIDRLEARVAKDKYLSAAELNHFLEEEVVRIFSEGNTYVSDNFELDSSKKPHVIMVVGVNGVGKTTSIGKLANQFKNKQGLNVVLGAADTFRAAAIDQLKIWGERTNVPVIAKEMGSDPASVAFDTLNSTAAQQADLVMIDTAGRLHNKIGLMEELSKVRRVMQKVIPDAPHEVLLVLDASTGQNAIEQAKQFTAATEVTGIILTKLDGTAKGGVVLGIADQFKIPVRFIGIGEGIDDLQVFDPQAFVKALFK
ncbi:MAG: signal recognition particle-docking protein FtsY [Saprospiraceae bacterium]|nr:signal recognition particle-docking protein FtsY [Saprospiraceae bacterium]